MDEIKWQANKHPDLIQGYEEKDRPVDALK